MVKDIIRNMRKDFRVEFREKSALQIAFSFAFIATLSVGLVMGGASTGARERSIILWLIMFFSAMSGLAHAFVREEEKGTALLLRLTSSPSAVFTAKLLFNLAFFLALQFLITLLFVFFVEGDVASPFPFALTILSGGTALASASTILSAMAARAGVRGALFPVMSLPITLPVLFAATGATAEAMERPGLAPGGDIIFLLAFSGAIIAVSYLVFEYIWIDE